MRPRREPQPASLPVQGIYSVADLARAAGVRSRVLRRLLRANGVTLISGGRALYVSLADIRQKIPGLFDGICLAEQVRSCAGRVPEPELDERD